MKLPCRRCKSLSFRNDLQDLSLPAQIPDKSLFLNSLFLLTKKAPRSSKNTRESMVACSHANTHSFTHVLSPILLLSPFLLLPPPQASQQYLDNNVKDAFLFDVVIVVEETAN